MSDWWSADPVVNAPAAPAAAPSAGPGPLRLTVHPRGSAPDGDGGANWWANDPVVPSGMDRVLGTAAGLGKAGASGLGEGVTGVVGLPDTIKQGAGWLVENSIGRAITGIKTGGKDFSPAPHPEPEPRMLDVPTSQQAKAAIEGVTGEFYKPQTTAEHYVHSAAEFIPATVMAPQNLVGNAIRYGAIPGVASEAAGRATKGTGFEVPARIAAGMGAAGIAGLASRPGSAARTVRDQMPDGVTPQMVDGAERLMQDAAGRGIALTWSEALSQVAGRPVMSNLARHLEAAPQTEARMAEFFGNRAPAMENAARNEFDQFAPRGHDPSPIGRGVGEAAEESLNDVKRGINNFTQPLYDRASFQRVSPADMARVRAHPGWEQARDAIRNEPQLNRYVEHLPEDSVGFLNEVKKQFDQAAENASSPVNAQRNTQISAGYQQDATGVRQIAERSSAAVSPGAGDYATALATQAHLRETILQPLLDGPLGKLASRDPSTKAAIDALFPANPIAGSAQEISNAVATVAQRRPNVARQLVRAHVETTFNEAAKDLQTGANQAGGAKFRARLVGNSQQAENLEAAVRALPHGDQIWTGFNRFLEIAEATGTRQNVGSKTAYNDEFLRGQSASNLVGEGVKVVANPMKAMQPLVDRYERWKLGRNLDQLATILTDARSVNLLRGIAAAPREGVGSRQAALRLVMLGNEATRVKDAPPRAAK